jgi:hypothetical protein
LNLILYFITVYSNSQILVSLCYNQSSSEVFTNQGDHVKPTGKTKGTVRAAEQGRYIKTKGTVRAAEQGRYIKRV